MWKFVDFIGEVGEDGCPRSEIAFASVVDDAGEPGVAMVCRDGIVGPWTWFPGPIRFTSMSYGKVIDSDPVYEGYGYTTPEGDKIYGYIPTIALAADHRDRHCQDRRCHHDPLPKGAFPLVVCTMKLEVSKVHTLSTRTLEPKKGRMRP